MALFRLRLEAGDFSGAEAAVVAAKTGWPEHSSVASAYALLEALTGAGGTEGCGAAGQGTAVADVRAQPSELELMVWPDPTSGSAMASFVLDEPARVRLAIYDVLGRRVALASEHELPAGPAEVPIRTRGLASGTYAVRLAVEGATGLRQSARTLTLAR